VNDTGTHMTRTYEPDDPGISLVGHDWNWQFSSVLRMFFTGLK
jgi:hypothetical protein